MLIDKIDNRHNIIRFELDYDKSAYLNVINYCNRRRLLADEILQLFEHLPWRIRERHILIFIFNASGKSALGEDEGQIFRPVSDRSHDAEIEVIHDVVRGIIEHVFNNY